MRTLCANPAVFWKPIPKHDSLAGISLEIYMKIIKGVVELEVNPNMDGHYCNTSAPCVVLRKAMRACIPLLSVCKVWKDCVISILTGTEYAKLRNPVTGYKHDGGFRLAFNYSIDGRYRAYKVIEEEHGKSVLYPYDYGGPGGCPSKCEVVIKFSNAVEQYATERMVYAYALLETPNTHADVPHLHFSGEFSPSPGYYGLVLTKLGPDLERLRVKCDQQIFTPRMTLAIAIQTIRIYERLHNKGWLHCNAKLGNFAIGPDTPGANTRIFMFDFEYSQRIGVKPNNYAACEGWNRQFKPVTWNMNLEPSRRDDLEGLGYVFSYRERGSHPWEGYSSDIETWRCKISTSTKTIFRGMDPAYMQYFDEVKALAWGEVPDYDGLVKRFVRVWEENGYGGTPGELDWWDELGLRI